jgi:hypothetical protein
MREATEAEIEERLPVWEVLSEFFLDTELRSDDYERIARALAATAYSEAEIEGILIGEVYPVCKWNLLTVAGEWAGFDAGWLKEKIAPYYGKRPRLRFLFLPMHHWMYARHWTKVKARMLEIRSQ